MCVHIYIHIYIYVHTQERERQKEKDKQKEREREKDRTPKLNPTSRPSQHPRVGSHDVFVPAVARSLPLKPKFAGPEKGIAKGERTKGCL